jgi:glycosyltransferase involved in cell wall biosynthesis
MPSAPAVLDVALLKNQPFGVGPTAANRGGVTLPYRIDHLIDQGLHLHYTDAPYHDRLRRFHDPLVQTVALAPHLLRRPATLAMFESSVHPYGLLRHRLPPARRGVLAVLSCWLPEVLADASPARLQRYREAYRTVDLLYAYSRNQQDLLCGLLDLDADRVRPIAFGVDHDELRPADAEATGPFLAAGRDRGRDWPTLLAALRTTGVPAQLLCRPADLHGLDVPPNVEVLGVVDRSRYRALLQQARAVLVPTRVVGYPSGQSVLLEAMACARPVIATSTPALDEYLDADRTALVVPPRDVEAWIEAVRAVDEGRVDVAALGSAARQEVERSFTAAAMWETVARDLRRLVADRGHHG